jgi:ribonuclease VapC
LSKVVLDASALLALLQGEPGSEAVATAIPGGIISAVNLSEVIAKLAEAGMPEAAIQAALSSVEIEIHPFDIASAYRAGLLRVATRHLGLSLGDRACLALARQLGLPALTTDRAWERAEIGVEVRVAR